MEPTTTPEVVPSAEPAIEEPTQETPAAEGDAPPAGAPAGPQSAADKEREKKEREKAKKKAKEAEKKAAEKEKKTKEAEKKAPSKGAAAKPRGGVAAQIKAFQQKVKEKEDEQKKAREEAEKKAREEEEARLAALKVAEEKKQKEREKLKAHKKKNKEGAAERAAAKRAAELRAQFERDQAIMFGSPSTEGETPKKTHDRRRRGPKGAAAESTAAADAAPASDATATDTATATATAAEAPADDGADDWEQLLEGEVAGVGSLPEEPKPEESPKPAESSVEKPAPEAAPKEADAEEGEEDEEGEEGEESSDEGSSSEDESGEEDDESDDDEDDEDDESSEGEKGKDVKVRAKGGKPPAGSPATAASAASASAAAELEEETVEKRAKRREEVLARHKQRMQALCAANTTAGQLRSPICCILGHVDTGKTKLLDKIRHTDVQGGEAGGITQQIGATFFPIASIQEQTRKLRRAEEKVKYEIPGLLIIDTPGHESFTNLRSRGSSLCNMAILVVDLMHGIEAQTEESMRLLAMRHTPFVIALNKIDRIYGWKPSPWAPFSETYAKQTDEVKTLFRAKYQEVVTSFAEKGYNVCIHTENKDTNTFISMVPTSAITGEGIPDLLMYLIAMTQRTLRDDISLINELTATVLEVKVIQGLGTTVDVVLSNGILREGDTIVVCGLNGPITTQIRALLTPQPCRELRVKSQYTQHREILAAMGVKISAQGLENAVAGSPLHVAYEPEEVEFLQELVSQDLESAMSNFERAEAGVCVQSSTIGSLEALLAYLKSAKVPVSGVSIGPIYKKDVVRASVMLERQQEYATILGFDVQVDPEAQRLADEMGVRIFTAAIIYHLTDMFSKYINDVREAKKARDRAEVVFPCQLSIVPSCIYNRIHSPAHLGSAFGVFCSDPIIIGVKVVAGILRAGTPLVVMTKEIVSCCPDDSPSTGRPPLPRVFAQDCDIGYVGSIEFNHRTVERASKDQEVAVKIVNRQGVPPKMFGRHFDEHDILCSKMTRKAIDVLKTDFRDELQMDDWKLVSTLKSHFNIS
ncbi:putative Eukaryotic translation initiation factor 5B [Paratrimastix pyriformis]|uniref:Eukaryotic translation initiation factor 5B n=1 Tax=Paratrimastix pyriformis TaxID=342808 RepID=A0ABQ8UV46_9EUKA|nr:putative Eukaryotic translation initiation factor 5B [Paratrimastix pyriformis]